MSFSDLDTLEPSLTRVDDLQREINSLKVAQPDTYARFLENWKVESTYNSNNIEGSTLSLGDIALLFDGAKVANAPQEDIDQAIGGIDAIRYVMDCLEARILLNEELIKGMHFRLFQESKDLEARGNYRKTEVEITGTSFQPCPAQFIEERMNALLGTIEKSKRHAVMQALLFHLEFESIHPFVNANGRTGRLASNYILMQNGYEPVNIQATDRALYIQCLMDFQLNDDPYPFASFFIANLISQQERCLALLGGRSGTSEVSDLKPSGVVEYLDGD